MGIGVTWRVDLEWRMETGGYCTSNLEQHVASVQLPQASGQRQGVEPITPALATKVSHLAVPNTGPTGQSWQVAPQALPLPVFTPGDQVDAKGAEATRALPARDSVVSPRPGAT